jgi:hypothetical protein
MDGSIARAQVMPQKFCWHTQMSWSKSWPRIEAASNQANVGWFLNTLAGLEEQGVFRVWKPRRAKRAINS